MKLGDTKTTEYVCRERMCEECDKPATHLLTFLCENARTNPASSGYGGDDISWCSDEEHFYCDEHENGKRYDPPRGMKWCADFYRYKKDGTESEMNGHRYLFWDKVNETIQANS